MRDLPKLATNEEWRGIMKRARRDHGLTQGGLAVAVGKRAQVEAPSQALISKIESGLIESSEFVIPICEVLSIPLPEHFVNEDDRDWVRLGRVLRAQDMDRYRKAMALLESMIDTDKEEPGEEQQPELPEPK